MATFYNIMLYGGLALAVIFAIVAIVLFFKLNIPKVIGDLTGSTAKKQIQEIREKGYESVQGAGVSKKDAIKTGTDSGRISARDINPVNPKVADAGRTRYEQAVSSLEQTKKAEEYLKSIHEDDTDVLDNVDAEELTDVLNENHAEEVTDILNEGYAEEATDVLNGGYAEEATDILSEDDEEATDVLAESDSTLENPYNTSKMTASVHVNRSSSVKKIMDVIVVHTDESI
ncbi:MAG: hypothetical protein ACI4EF_02905 [Coprococcus sp.]